MNAFLYDIVFLAFLLPCVSAFVPGPVPGVSNTPSDFRLPVTQATAEAGIPTLPNLAPQTQPADAAVPPLPFQPQIVRDAIATRNAKAQVEKSGSLFSQETNLEKPFLGQPMPFQATENKPAQAQALKPAQAQAAATAAAAATPKSNGYWSEFFGQGVYPGAAIACLLIVSGGVVAARKRSRGGQGQGGEVGGGTQLDGPLVISRGSLQDGERTAIPAVISGASLQNLFKEAKLMEQETVREEEFQLLTGEHFKNMSPYKVFSENYGADALQANSQLTCLFIMKTKGVPGHPGAIVCRAAPVSADNAIPDMEKRNLMNLILLGSLATTIGGLGGPFIYYFYPAGTGGSTGGLVAKDALGDDVTFKGWLDTHQAGERKLVQGLKGDATYLLITEDKTIQNFGLNAVCTHLGCVVPWNKAENKFMCPCHGSQYNAEGKVVRGPAPLSLALAHVDAGEGDKVTLTTWVEEDFRTGLKPWWN